MSESPETRALREKMALRWDDRRQDAIAAKIVVTHRRRRVVRRVGAATAAILVVATGFALSRRAGGPEQQTLADGSTIERLESETTLAVSSDAPGEVRVSLERGRARFAVTKDPKRVFRVQSGDVSVVVLGTVFEVGRAGAHTRVKVSEGRVRVTRGELTMLLGPGEERELETVAPAAPDPVEAPVPPPAPAPPERTPPPLTKAKAPAAAVPTLTETLWEVDRLRLAKDAAGAAELLKKALRRHPRAAETPQATFVLGRLQQEDLHDAKAAARSFATVRRLAPTSPIAEDALAREVECLVASGDSAGARERLALYEEAYPRGAHRERLKKLAPR
ncbi:MAG: FecR domain-containing protein [Myxococcota bacterium]